MIKKTASRPDGRVVRIGDPKKVQIALTVDKSTGEVTNKDEIVDMLDDAEVDELKELYVSLRNKKPRARKKDPLVQAILKHLEQIEAGYVEAASVDVTPARPKPATRATRAAKAKVEHVAKTTSTSLVADEAGSIFARDYKGVRYELKVTEAGYNLSCPGPASGYYRSPSAAARAITGYSNVNGRKWFGMVASARKVGSRKDAGPRRHHIKKLAYRDPRLPEAGATLRRTLDDGRVAVVTTGAEDFAVLVETAKGDTPLGRYASMREAAKAVDPEAGDGFKFFGVEWRSEKLDPARILAAVLLLEGSDIEAMGERVVAVMSEDTFEPSAGMAVYGILRAVNEAEAKAKAAALLGDRKTD